jgi:hypothetical protein
MRFAAMVLCVMLLAAACGDDDAASTSTAPPTTQAPSTTIAATTSTSPATTVAPTSTEPGPVAVASLCVIGRAPGEVASVRTGPDASFGLLAQLPHDATGIGATGETAIDEEGSFWTEIIWEGESAWVRSLFLTPGNCNPDAGAATYAAFDVGCGGWLNVRDGLSEDHNILGQLDAEAYDITGTGVTAQDSEGRTWVQIVFEGRNAWAAGWFLTTDPGPTVVCGPPPLPWLITADALGPIDLGTQASTLGSVTGWTWDLSDANNDCTWYTSNDVGVQARSGVIVEIWAMSGTVAVTPEGFTVGQTKAQALATFGGRALVVPGPYAGEVLIIDAPNWQANFTYLLLEDPYDTSAVGTIRINDDGGYIEGGCS